MEARQMMAANLTATLSAGVLVIEGTNNADNITVRQVNNNISVAGINIISGGRAYSSVSANSVSRIEVNGLAGNDSINLASDAYSGQQGIARMATVHGGAGDDMIWGTTVGDVLLGDDGNDQLMGRNGNDQLNGGAGVDKMWGGDGDDVLIGIDGGSVDTVQGDAGRDIMWIDSNDLTAGATSEDKVQRVASFANGADRTLNGDSIADPRVHVTGLFQTPFKTNPLFSSSGPSMNDIKQGGAGDCYLLAGLSAIAMDNPQAVRQNVVDFNDGTFGVQLGGKFYRVDNDLPTDKYGSLYYAKLGADNSMWVAVVEKAFAMYRTGANSYTSIDNGWSIEINKAWGSTAAGAKDIQTYSSATALVNDMYAKWNTYQAVTIGFLNARYTSQASASIVTQHMYTVASFNRNSSGVITSVVLRNPWGYDGRGNDGNTNDGRITVTPAQLMAYYGQVNWGKV